MLRIATCLVIAAVLGVGAAPAMAGKPAHAGNPGHGHGPPAGHGGPSHGGGPPDSDDGGPVAAFSVTQRSSYEGWYREAYGGGCPPGLAKKHNGCMPPGLAKKRYVVGAPLPSGVVLAPLPSSLSVVIGVPPAGYLYGIVDGDVVKLAIGTALVVDAIQGLAH